ncbi:biotin/lipoyl-containing protein [Pelagicoccus mobilis]|uniref:Uncharacterized protein n=1 Tax=Pelagicoccus mobilis TaxID=415221 RepID=A0A934S0C5_9BACT|nr:biotin/lipoyl-containing protein [Pelagicoccus mobilis]MBK1878221.1 hypothetical protein [Pelagicoccus mobilis]
MVVRTITNIPQANANDQSAIITSWQHSTGSKVNKGEVVCTLENTKSVFDVYAEEEGYLYPLHNDGESLPVGAALYVISSDKDDTEKAVRDWVNASANTSSSTGAPPTKKAIILAKRHNIDLSLVPSGGARVSEKDVQAYLAKQSSPSSRKKAAIANLPRGADTVLDSYKSDHKQNVLIIGAGNGAVQILDALRQSDTQQAVGLLDDDPDLSDKTVMGLPILGGCDSQTLASLWEKKSFDAAIVSISTNNAFRKLICERLKEAGIPLANVIHPRAYIGMNAKLGSGNVILAFCQIAACAEIGDDNFLSAYVSIEHHSKLGNHNSFGPGVLTSSSVQIADQCKFGTGVFIEPWISIGSKSVIASGCTITQDVSENTIVKSTNAPSSKPLPKQ